MRELPKRAVWGGLVMAAMFAIVGWIVWHIPPGKWWIEAGVLVLVWGGLFVGGSWIIQRKKWSFILSLWLVGMLVMKRVEILDLPLFGLWVLVLGLVGLVN